MYLIPIFFFSSRRRHTRFSRDWSSDVCSSDLLGGTGTPTPLSGLQQGQNLLRGTYYIDNTTTGNVATYTIPADATQIVFTGSGSITLQGATIIGGKAIDWVVDATATVEVTFVNDGAPTVTQERFRGPSLQDVTIRAGESVTSVYFFNRHRILSVGKVPTGATGAQGEQG